MPSYTWQPPKPVTHVRVVPDGTRPSRNTRRWNGISDTTRDDLAAGLIYDLLGRLRYPRWEWLYGPRDVVLWNTVNRSVLDGKSYEFGRREVSGRSGNKRGLNVRRLLRGAERLVRGGDLKATTVQVVRTPIGPDVRVVVERERPGSFVVHVPTRVYASMRRRHEVAPTDFKFGVSFGYEPAPADAPSADAPPTVAPDLDVPAACAPSDDAPTQKPAVSPAPMEVAPPASGGLAATPRAGEGGRRLSRLAGLVRFALN